MLSTLRSCVKTVTALSSNRCLCLRDAGATTALRTMSSDATVGVDFREPRIGACTVCGRVCDVYGVCSQR